VTKIIQGKAAAHSKIPVQKVRNNSGLQPFMAMPCERASEIEIAKLANS
jgi:hypothetical protein